MAAVYQKARELSETERLELESSLVRFDRQWTPDSLGKRWQVVDTSSPLRLPALAEMVKIDMEHQWRRGQRVRLESYLDSYPALGTPDAVSADLIQSEYETRRQFGESVTLSEYAERFPRQAEELERLVIQARQLIADAEFVEAAKATSSIADANVATWPPKSPDATQRIGTQLGRYHVRNLLGQGGMGAVYLAYDAQLERDVALKIPHFSAADGPAAVERFYREARAAATLSHPNICPTYDVGEIDGVHYMTMAYIEGKPLSKFIDRDKPTKPRQVAHAILQLAKAMHEAHRYGVVHRDLKPSNIMRDKRGQLLIMDFGLARRTMVQGNEESLRLTHSGMILGTPAYMPPEQVSGDTKAVGPASDIYSLGIVMYELLTGELPFEGPAALVLGQIMVVEPKSPREVNVDLDPLVAEICMKAMSKKIEDRYASMAELATALEQYIRRKSLASIPSATDPSRIECDASAAGRAKGKRGPATSRDKGIPTSGSTDHVRVDSIPKGRNPDSSVRRNWLTAIAASVLFLTAAAIVWSKTNTGHIVVDVVQADIPEFRLIVRRDGEQIRIIDPKLETEVSVPAGTYQLELSEAKDALQLSTTQVRLTRNSRETVRVTRDMDDDSKPGTILWQDDFERDSLARYGQELPSRPQSWLIKDGLLMHKDTSREDGGKLLLPMLLSGDAVAEFSVVPVGENVHDANFDFGGVVIIYGGNANRQGWIDKTTPDGTVHGTRVDLAIPSTRSTRVRITRIGTQTTLAVDGLIRTVSQFASLPTDPSRAVGFLGDHLGANVGFDKLVVRRPTVAEYEGAGVKLPMRWSHLVSESQLRQRRLVGGWHPSWSPDGERVVYGLPNAEGLVIADLSTGVSRPLCDRGKDAAWSPDGRYIAFVHTPTDYKQEIVYLISPGGGEPRELLHGSYPIWIRDGRTIVSYSHELKRLVSVDVDSSAAAPNIYYEGTLSSFYNAVSPDEQFIASSRKGTFYLLDRAKQERVAEVKVPRARGILPAWSADGRYVAFGGYDGDPSGIWIYDSNTQQEYCVAEGPFTGPAWSPDGMYLAVDRRDAKKQLWEIQIFDLPARFR